MPDDVDLLSVMPTPLLVVGGIVVVAVVGGAAFYGYRKMSVRREQQASRAHATRPRPNK